MKGGIKNGVLLLISCLILQACKKEPIQYIFKGVVTESASGGALSGADVSVTQRTYNGSVASSYFVAGGEAVSSSSGSYEISFDREKVFEFKVEMLKSGYFDYEEIIGSAYVSTENPNVVDHEMEPKSWITFHLKNIGGMDTDEFSMIHYNFRTGCMGCTTNTFFTYTGQVDSTFTILTTGGVYTKYAYKNPGFSVYNQDSVYTTPFDTVFVNINY